MEPKVLEFVNSKERLDLPDLVNMLLRDGKRIQGYIIDQLWLHLSRSDDFENANDNWRNIIRELGLESSLNIYNIMAF